MTVDMLILKKKQLKINISVKIKHR